MGAFCNGIKGRSDLNPGSSGLRGRQIRWHPCAISSRRGARRNIFTRPATDDRSIPRAREKGRKFEEEIILDGEIIAFEQGRRLTFFDLQKRLGRKNEGADLFSVASADVPVSFVAFDLLWKNGYSYLRTPLRDRRELLRRLKF